MNRVVGVGTRRRRGASIRHGVALFITCCGLAGLLAACGSGDAPLAVVDPGAAPLQPTYSQAKGILDYYCLPCHGGGGGARREPAPAVEEDGESIDVSSCEAIHQSLSGILDTSVDGNSMPPGALPRLTEREKLTLKRWIAQGACSPCTQGCP